MTELKVVAFDPGLTTGYATGVINDGKMGVVSGQDKWNELQLYLQLQMVKPDIIIYERFEYRSESAYGKKGNLGNVELFSRNLIGVINLYCQQNIDNIEVYTQMPAAVLGKYAFFSDEKLKEARVYKRNQPHANDAMRHLLYAWQFGPLFKYNSNGFEPLA